MGQTEIVEKSGATMSGFKCNHQFGFLSQRPKGVAIPDECFICEKMLDCTISRPEGSGPTVEIVEVEPEIIEDQKQDQEIAPRKGKAEEIQEIEDPAKNAVDPEPEQIEVVEEVDDENPVGNNSKTIVDEPPKSITEQVRKRIGHIVKLRIPKLGTKAEPAESTEKTANTASGKDFRVDSPGTLYNQWSATVLISKDIFELWGKKVKEVELITKKGRITICKAHPVQNLASDVIQVPNKIKASLRIEDGARIKVKPIEK